MELVTVKNESVVSVQDEIAPITNPIGVGPASYSISAANAGLMAGGGGSANAGEVGIESQSAKNMFFLAVVAFLVWKYGRKVLSA